MFDSVGRDLDEDALRRSAQASLIVTLLSGLGAGTILLAGLWVVRETNAIEQLEEMVEVAMQEEPAMEAPPPPPPPPPPPAASAQEEEQEEETEPTPDEMVDKVEELKQEVKEEIKSDVKPAGVEGGVEGGVVGGQVGGVQGGIVGGVVGGQLGGQLASGPPPKIVHHSEIEWKKKIEPVYPAAAKGMSLGEQACKVVMKLDAEGVPTDLNIDGCPDVFKTEAKRALLMWRAYPLKVGGEKVPRQTTIIVKYRET